MNVLITRAAEQLAETVNIFSAHGLSPYCMPVIQTVALPAPEFKYKHYDYCILTSQVAVKFFAPYAIGASKYVTVGTATAKAAVRLLKVPEDNIVISQSAYISGIEEYFSGENVTGKRVIAPGALERIKDLGGSFHAKNAFFEAPTLYETASVLYNKGEIEAATDRYNIEAVTFFSPSAVNALFDQAALPETVRCAAIGKTTAESLCARGKKPLCGERQTAESLAQMLKQISDA